MRENAKMVLAFLFLVLLLWVLTITRPEAEPEVALKAEPEVALKAEPKTPEEIRAEQISTQFCTWDGSHLNLVAAIKETMHDPDSFKHDRTRYTDKGDHLVVYMEYRGKNLFGGMVRQAVLLWVDLNGNAIKMEFSK